MQGDLARRPLSEPPVLPYDRPMSLRGALLVSTLALQAACSHGGGGGPQEAGAGGAGGSAGEPDVYTLDLTGFGTQAPVGLAVANETLVFPLAREAQTQALSESNRGDLVVEYTRVGCWAGVDPTRYTFHVREVERVPVLRVTIDQFVGAGGTITPQQLADGTCLSLQAQDGTWAPFLRADRAELVSDYVIRVEFAVDEVRTSGAAIFLPTYTTVSSISYRVAPR